MCSKPKLLEMDFPLQNFLEQLSSAMDGKIKQKRQHFTVCVSQDMPAAIVADRQRLAQVITHLLNNAHKFAPQGGNIALYCMKTGGNGQRCQLLIEVEHDGADTVEEHDISRDMVYAMGGEIWAEAWPHKGCVFSFTIEVGIGISAVNPPPEVKILQKIKTVPAF